MNLPVAHCFYVDRCKWCGMMRHWPGGEGKPCGGNSKGKKREKYVTHERRVRVVVRDE